MADALEEEEPKVVKEEPQAVEEEMDVEKKYEDDEDKRKRDDDDDDDDRRDRKRRDDDDDDDRRRDRRRRDRRYSDDEDRDRSRRRTRDYSDDDSDDRRDRRRRDRSEEDDRRGKRGRRDDDSADDDRRGASKKRRSDSEDIVERTLDVDKDDAAFILGRGGSTKKKIAKVAGCEIDLEERDSTICLRGTEKECDRAEDYLDFVKQQRLGPVTINLDRKRDDFTAYRVPEDCIGFVMGRNGATLRSMEEEWGVLMFFAKTKVGGRDQDASGAESLCIFGDLAARRGAEVKVMSAVEHKHPGYCVSSRNELRELERVPGDEDVDGWGCDTMPLSEESYSYVLGSKGNTRRKLAKASGCVIEYVGRLACFAGYKKDRRRGRDYLTWLLEQRKGASVVDNPRDRDDCTVVKVPSESIAFITGHRGESLREVEKETGTFCFSDGDRNDRNKQIENLLIFSYSRDARNRAADLIEDRIDEHKRIGGPRPPKNRDNDRRRGDDDSRYGPSSRGSYGRSRDDDDRADRRRRRRDDDDDDDRDRRRRRRDEDS